MRKSCRQLACGERCQIKVLLSRGLSIRESARNHGERGYRHRQGSGQGLCPPQPCFGRSAQADGCAMAAHPRPAAEGWSPEQIESRLKLLGEETAGREWICRQVRAAGIPAEAAFRGG